MVASVALAAGLGAPAIAQPAAPTPNDEVLPPPQPKAAPPRAAAKKSAESDASAAPPLPPPGCGYLGKRVVQSLLRDDAVTGGDFERLYRTFSCSSEHLHSAFDCTVVAPLPANANDVTARVEACWADPKFDSKQVGEATPAAPPTQAKGETKGETKGGATKGSEAKGESKGKDAKGSETKGNETKGETRGGSDSKGESRANGKATSAGTPNYPSPPKGQ
jgi:hypothetical protein